MEMLLEDQNHIIVRLPQIVGLRQNQKNLIPFIYNSIKNDVPFYVQKDTYRSIIDVEDVVKFTKYLIRKKNLNLKTISFLNTNYITVEEIVEILESILKKRACYKLIKSKYIKERASISNDVVNLITESGIQFNSEYNKELLMKYYDK